MMTQLKFSRPINALLVTVLTALCLVFSFVFSGAAEAATRERVRYYIPDHAGSPMRVATPEGFVVAKYRYAPMGEQIADKAPSGSRARLGFVGGVQERADVVYLKHRYYNPVLGRFYQPDPVGFFEGGSKQINRFSYGLNDSFQYSDANGRELIALADTALDIASVVWDLGFVTYHYLNGNVSEAKEKSIDVGISLGSLTVPYANAWILKAGKGVANTGGKYTVGAYNEIKGTVSGLDAHHVGQKALMKDMIPGYDPATAPSILVPKVGHTIKGPNGIVSRSTEGLTTPRDVIARDIWELRRVYPDVPNSQLQKLIQMNKDAYPGSFSK